ncbi:SseB family protein [Nonomuraea sp. NPDC048826]|uniref:SseB family protein n=1 Tax=Nonomuraea sp. NPDC048826 TaxID=3364347 RepID=UPI003720CF35
MTLADAAVAFGEGELDAAGLHEVFLASPVYCEAPETPGVRVRLVDGRRLVPVFTSLAAFEGFTDHRAWFRTTGEDLLAQLPPGLQIVLDPGSPRALRLGGGS